MIMESKIYHDNDGDISLVKNDLIAVIGYGNQAKAQALNMRDSGLEVRIGAENEQHRKRAEKDEFQVLTMAEALQKARQIFLLISDDEIKESFDDNIKPHLDKHHTLIFYSGYVIVHDLIELPKNLDVVLISPRVCGKGVRENYLNKKGLFSFIGVHQDVSGRAKQNMLALAKAIGALSRGAVETTLEQQTKIGLFTEQTYVFAFKQILMRSIANLIEAGYPPEAIFVELLLSGEASFTIEKGQDVGFIKQMNFHSQTSQYGQMSRAIRFRKTAGEVNQILKGILEEIKDGSFAKEWEDIISRDKLDIMKYHAFNSHFTDIEQKVRRNLKIPEMDVPKELQLPKNIHQNPELREFYQKFKDFYEDFNSI